MIVERVFFTRADLQPALRFRYPLDGSEIRNSVLMGRGIQADLSTTAWEGEKLVIRTAYSFDDPESGREVQAEVQRTLSLQRPGPGRSAWPPSLVIETKRNGVAGAKPSITRTVYTKD